MRTARALLVGATLLILTSGTTWAQTLNSETTTTHVRGAIRMVVVDNENGDVTLRPSAESSVTRTEPWDFVRPTYEQSVSDGVLTVRASCPPLPVNGCSVDLLVLVPRTAVVQAETVNGEMPVARFSGARSPQRPLTARSH